jgi:hypothetical protein
MVVGPFMQLDIGGGTTADVFLLRFGPAGEALSPRTEQILKDSLPGITDVFLFSHGWNNTFEDAAGNYRQFIDGYMAQHALTPAAARPPGYRPLLIGVIWPSISFLMPWEDGPQIAGPGDAARNEEMRRFVTESLDADAAAELSELIDGRTELAPDEARSAAEIVRAALRSGDDPDDGSANPEVEEILEAWALLDGDAAASPPGPDDFGDQGPGPAAATGPQIAGVNLFDPRNLLRVGTMWEMKERAGTVGARGVAPLVRHVLAQSTARLHLIGHSFGARLLMSALAVPPAPARKARSLLLLQAAVNRWCFAADVDGTGRSGGYRPVLDRVELPIISTFSSHDVPLRQAFHLALRGGHLGEPNIAAVGNTDRYGALGGYGPAGLGAAVLTEAAVAEGKGPYRFDTGARVLAVDGSGFIGNRPAIDGHGDINNPVTWWALHCLTGAP